MTEDEPMTMCAACHAPDALHLLHPTPFAADREPDPFAGPIVEMGADHRVTIRDRFRVHVMDVDAAYALYVALDCTFGHKQCRGYGNGERAADQGPEDEA